MLTHRVPARERFSREDASRAAIAGTILILALTAILWIDVLPTQSEQFQSGDLATRDIIAPRPLEMESAVLTAEAREAARARVDVTLAVLPLSFDYGQNQLLSSWYAGASVAPLDYLTARDVVKAVARHGVTTLAGVPPLWVQLVESDWPAGTAALLRRLTNSGGALTPSLVDEMRATFPNADIYPMYGLTEAFRSTYLDPSLVASTLK